MLILCLVTPRGLKLHLISNVLSEDNAASIFSPPTDTINCARTLLVLLEQAWCDVTWRSLTLHLFSFKGLNNISLCRDSLFCRNWSTDKYETATLFQAFEWLISYLYHLSLHVPSSFIALFPISFNSEFHPRKLIFFLKLLISLLTLQAVFRMVSFI